MREHFFKFFAAAIGFVTVIHTCTIVSADLVNDLPQQTLSHFMELSLKDTTKTLAPARAAFEKGQIDECRRMLERAAAESGIIPHPEVQLASWYVSAGKLAAAQQVMEKVSLTESTRPDVRWMFCEMARGQGRLFDAWTHANLAERLPPPKRWDPKYAKHMRNLIARSKALIADQRGDWETSEKLFKAMITQGIRTYEVENALGRAAFFLDRPDDAFKHFQRACDFPQVESNPILLMAAHYEQKGDEKETEAWFKKGDAEGNDDAEKIRIAYCRWLIRQNRSADARKEATKRRPSEKNRGDFEFVVALCERMEGRFSVAEKILSRLNLSKPQDFSIANQLALMLVETKDQGKLGRAMQLAQKNVRNFPNSTEAISTYGWVQYRLGDSTAANQTFRVLLQGGQASRDAVFYIAQVQYALQQKQAGDVLIDAAKTSEGEFFNAHRVDKKI